MIDALLYPYECCSSLVCAQGAGELMRCPRPILDTHMDTPEREAAAEAAEWEASRKLAKQGCSPRAPQFQAEGAEPSPVAMVEKAAMDADKPVLVLEDSAEGATETEAPSPQKKPKVR